VSNVRLLQSNPEVFMKQAVFLLLVGLIVLCGSCSCGRPDVSIAVRTAETEPRAGLEKMTFSGWGASKTFYLGKEVFLDEADIVSAKEVAWDEHPAVEVLLTEAGRETFADVTARHIGRHLAVLVDGELACVPMVRDTIHQGKILINGDFTEERARSIVEALNRR
jgi:preprotein translocase subunit SecD